jgi:hypothetical protein
MRRAWTILIVLLIIAAIPVLMCLDRIARGEPIRPTPETKKAMVGKIEIEFIPAGELTLDQKRQLEWLALPREEQNRILKERFDAREQPAGN